MQSIFLTMMAALKLKIGFDAKRLFLNNTGLGNYSRTLVKNLHRYYPQHEYHLFTPEVKENETSRYFLDNDFFIHTPPSYLPGSLWRSRGMARKINDLNLDIYHGLSHEIPPGISSKTLKVLTIHDLIFEKYPKLFSWYDRWLYTLKYKSSCSRANQIVGVSKATCHDVETLYLIDRQKISLIYQSCDEVFQNHTVRHKEKSYFLYVGTINERKGLLDAVKAYGMLEEKFQLPFVVVGAGGTYADAVKSAVSRLGLTPKFNFMGNLPNRELVEVYANALCLVLPSAYEGFGIPVAEALFTGTPVITSNTSALPEAAGPGGIILQPGNVAQLAQAMADMFDETRWNEFSDKGRNYVASHFDSASTAEALMNLYYRLMGTTAG
ncbi:MAG: glycosyltransferase family 4 protein [Saprospiraceae bacterium]|nr:glycosyltransferase family 4 protein [Saprospiraceae bacterium]